MKCTDLTYIKAKPPGLGDRSGVKVKGEKEKQEARIADCAIPKERDRGARAVVSLEDGVGKAMSATLGVLNL